jgi:hypothetical protein
VQKWSLNPNVQTGFSAGFSLIVEAQRSFMSYVQPLSPISTPLSTNDFAPVPGMQISFTLETNTTLRLFYHVPVRPDNLPMQAGTPFTLVS